MASEKGNVWIEMLIHYYDDRHFILPDGSYDMKGNNVIITEESTKNCGFRLGDMNIDFGNVKLYPRVYFLPYTKKVADWTKDDINKVKSFYKVKEGTTVCIHYGTGTWIHNRNTGMYKVKHIVRRIFPEQAINILERIYYKHHKWNSKK